MQQLSKIIESRQEVYAHALLYARDAQFELIDALLLSPALRVSSYPLTHMRARPPEKLRCWPRGRRAR